jgi:hypothetical protein
MQALPFVEAEVTASHENGRRCTEINDRKTIANVSDGDRSGCYPINPKVEAEVTAKNHSLQSIIYSATKDLHVIDTTEGAKLELTNTDTIFILIPRNDAIQKLTHVHKTLESLYALDHARTYTETRGKTRITVAEDDGKYTTVGLKAARGHPGITECWPTKFEEHHKDQVERLIKNCEECAKGYIKSHDLRGIEVARMLGGWRERKGGTSKQVWGSLACGKNHYLNSHTDEDFFYSLTTTASSYGLLQNTDRYRMDAEVCNYFTFPEQGLAVALRPGDMLLFNPMYHHCLSSRTCSYEKHDVFCLSLYLKTAIVGKNDNSLPLTKREIDVLQQGVLKPSSAG